jgi:hypothetical protein
VTQGSATPTDYFSFINAEAPPPDARIDLREAWKAALDNAGTIERVAKENRLSTESLFVLLKNTPSPEDTVAAIADRCPVKGTHQNKQQEA